MGDKNVDNRSFATFDGKNRTHATITWLLQELQRSDGDGKRRTETVTKISRRRSQAPVQDR